MKPKVYVYVRSSEGQLEPISKMIRQRESRMFSEMIKRGIRAKRIREQQKEGLKRQFYRCRI